MRRARDDSGQVIVLAALALPVLLILAGFVIDYGGSLVLKRHAQASADASALAAIWSIPNGIDAERSTALAYAGQNTVPGLDPSMEVDPATSAVPGDSVSVKVSGAWTTVFAKIAGVTSIGVHATATATAQSVYGCSGHGCDVLPWGVPDCAVHGSSVDCSQPLAVSFGTRVRLKVDSGSGGKFYGLADPVEDGGCQEAVGAGDYSRSIGGVWGDDGALTCNVRATPGPSTGWSTDGCDYPDSPSVPTCVVQVKTGNMVGPTAKGLEDRLGCADDQCNGDSLSSITGGCDPATAPGAFCPVLHESPRLVTVPIVRNLDNSSGYDACSAGATCEVKVIDLAWFYIDASYDDISGGTVTGTFFRSTPPKSFDLTGPYNGGSFVRAKLTS